MHVETHTISPRAKNDVTKDFLAQFKSKDSCAGTFHRVGEHEYPCIGDGLLCTKYEQTHYVCSTEEHADALGKVQDITKMQAEQSLYGDPNPNAKIETVSCVPKVVASCPCVMSARLNDYDKSLLGALGLESLPKLYENQQTVADAFKRSRSQSLFIYGDSGGGKTVLAAACAVGFHRKVRCLVGNEIAEEWRNRAMNGLPLDYDGLLVLDDLDKTQPTDAFKEKLWYVFDRVAKKKLRLVITTNLSPQAFAEKYTAGRDEVQSMVSRISKFEAVEL